MLPNGALGSGERNWQPRRFEGSSLLIGSVRRTLYHNLYHRWPALTSAHQRKIGQTPPDSSAHERPRALGSYLISVRSVVQIYPGPVLEVESVDSPTITTPSTKTRSQGI